MKKHIAFFKTKYIQLFICALSISIFTWGCASAPNAGARRSSSKVGLSILITAKTQIGNKYRFGGTSPKTGFDCSGFAWWSHKKNGINIPRMSSDQYRSGKGISIKNLMPGDLLYFETYKKGASHVGIYDGKGGFLHSPNSKRRVQRTRLTNTYYKKRYLGARRYW